MDKKFIIILIIVLFVGGLFLFFNSGEQTNISIISQDIPADNLKEDEPVNLGLLDQAYKAKVKVVLANYLRQVDNEDLFGIDQVEQVKGQLLSMKVPKKFQELHLNLVLALNNMKDYLENGKIEQKQASQDLINQAKIDYEWLN